MFSTGEIDANRGDLMIEPLCKTCAKLGEDHTFYGSTMMGFSRSTINHIFRIDGAF
jgi:hypothetical protein